MGTSSSSWRRFQTRSRRVGCKAKFHRISGEIARDHLGKCHETGLRVGCHGEAALEGSSTVSRADPGLEDEGVAAVEGDSWLDED
jgi:hypothetical protein